jgi:selenocysteine lyase/cysteine desulfurase
VPIDVRAVRRRFPALDATPTRVVHADAPGGTQVLDGVIAAMSAHLRERNANAHGTFPTSVATDETCARVRDAVGSFLGTEPEGVVFGANMTTLTLHLARALEPRLARGDTIVSTRLDHDANVSPWLLVAERRGAEVRFVDLRDDGTLDLDDLERAVDSRPRAMT